MTDQFEYFNLKRFLSHLFFGFLLLSSLFSVFAYFRIASQFHKLVDRINNEEFDQTVTLYDLMTPYGTGQEEHVLITMGKILDTTETDYTLYSPAYLKRSDVQRLVTDSQLALATGRMTEEQLNG